MKKMFPLKVMVMVMVMPFFSRGQEMVVKVWPGGAPDSNGMTLPEEKYDGVRVRNVSEAEMTVFLPPAEKNSGAAVVICPGGGYMIEAMDHEGFEIARWLADRGVAGIVLKYRLPYGHHAIPSSDARQALRMVRHHAAEWGIDPSRVGIAGSSAGGHLASTVGTRFDGGEPGASDSVARQSCRPDFMLLLYPVITMKEEFTHLGSRRNLIGEGNDMDLVALYSNELHVTAATPPTFLVLADDDKAVVPRNSLEFYTALKRNGGAAEMHIFARGGHGFGMRKNDIPADQWPHLFLIWLSEMGIIKGDQL